MDGWLWAILLKPFVLFVFLCVVAAIHIIVRRVLPDGKFKEALLKDRFPPNSLAHRNPFHPSFAGWHRKTRQSVGSVPDRLPD